MTAHPPRPAPSSLARELESVAVAVALEAARHVADHRADLGAVSSKSSATDLVTDVDRATEALIIAAIRARRPGDAVLGEESGSHPAQNVGPGAGAAGDSAAPAADRVEWVVDPIDGTVNFVLGLPSFSVSVAARQAGVTLAGCVVDVSRGEVFHACRGGGSWLAGPGGSADVRLAGPRPVGLSGAVVGTGFAYDAGMRIRQAQVVVAIIGQVGNLRRLGSAALDLCYVAAGRLDAYFEAGLKEWDRAAGWLIAAEAGVVVAELGPVTYAVGPDLAAPFLALIDGAGAAGVTSG